MKIGIDAKWYFNGPVSGKVILQNVLPELIRQFPDHEWCLFMDKADRGKPLPFTASNVSIRYVWAGLNMLSNLFVLPSYIKKFRLELVLYQTFPAKVRNCRAVAFIHDVLYEHFPGYFTGKELLYLKPLRWLAPHADRIVTTTDTVKKDLLKFGYARDPTRVDLAPLGVSPVFKPLLLHDPLRIEQVQSHYRLPPEFLLFVGRLNIRKNIGNLLKALPLLEDRKIPLVIVGEEDWKSPRLQESLSDERVSGRVQFTGSVSDEDLPVIYALAKIFCYPSFAEGFGLPPLEAMASGIPVVVSDTTSLPEVCGPAGNYIDPQKPESIANMIDKILTDKDLYKEKAEEGLLRARQFSWEASASALMKSLLRAAETPASQTNRTHANPESTQPESTQPEKLLNK